MLNNVRKSLIVSPLLALLTACGSSDDHTHKTVDARFDVGQYQQFIAKPDSHTLEGRWLMIGNGKLDREESTYVANKPRLEEKYLQTFALRQVVYIRKNTDTDALEFIHCDGTGARPLTATKKSAKTTFGSQANDLDLTIEDNGHMTAVQRYEERYSDTRVENFELTADLYRLAPDQNGFGNLTLDGATIGQDVLTKNALTLTCFSETLSELSITDYDKLPEDPDFHQNGPMHELVVEAATSTQGQTVAVEISEILDEQGIKEVEASIQLNGIGTEDAMYSFWNRSAGTQPSLDIDFKHSTPDQLDAVFTGKAEINQAFNGRININF